MIDTVKMHPYKTKSSEFNGDLIRYSSWQDLLSLSPNTSKMLTEIIPIDQNEIDPVIKKYPMQITPYYLSLIEKKDDAIWRQAIPDIRELDDTEGEDDPFYENFQSPVSNLIHRYPDRVLFIVSNKCAMYCRFCFRKRMVGKSFSATEEAISQGIEYIKKNKMIREVILSGGDPLLLQDNEIQNILAQIHAIPHVDIIRIHTRVPCTIPQRITTHLVNIIKKYHPIFIHIHFNHPNEITSESAFSCGLLADAGIPLGSQSVLLKGINDDPFVMKQLMTSLIKIRVKPHYIHHPDLVKGTFHFRVPVQTGLDIMKRLRGYTSGLCIPQYMLDLPKGGGKIPLIPEYAKMIENGKLKIENYRGETFLYPTD